MNFSSDQRLKKPAEFSAVYSNNQTRVKGQYFTVLAFSRFISGDNCSDGVTMPLSTSEARIGVVASKRVSKLAVQRNRIKRIMRESFRKTSHPQGFDFVVVALPASAQATNEDLHNEMSNAWRRLHKRCAQL